MVMIGVGLLVGFSFDASPLEVVAGIGLMLLFGYAFSWIFAYLGLTASSFAGLSVARYRRAVGR